MNRLGPLGAITLVSLVFATSPLRGGGGYMGFGPLESPVGCGPCQVQFVAKTIYVPQWTTETRQITTTAHRPETRTRTHTVCRPVAETHEVTEEYTVMEAESHTRQQSYQVSVPVKRVVQQEYQVRVPVWRQVDEQYTVRVPQVRHETRSYQVRVPVARQVDQQYTVMVPQVQTHTGVRQVCRTVPVTSTRIVCRDAGHWENQLLAPKAVCHGWHWGAGACGTCGGCAGKIQRVWVPNMVQQEVPFTTYKQVVSHEPYQYQVTTHRPETRTRKVTVYDYRIETRSRTVAVCEYRMETRTRKRSICDYRLETRTRNVTVCEYRTEPRTRTVHYTNWVPRQKTRTRQVTTWRNVLEQKTSEYTVMVPYQVQRDVQVPVCQMVPITVNVPVVSGWSDCGGNLFTHFWRRGGC